MQASISKSDLFKLYNENKPAANGTWIVVAPVIYLIGLTILTGYLPLYGMSAWFSTLVVAIVYTVYRGQQPPEFKSPLRELLDIWKEHVERTVIGRRIAFIHEGDMQLAGLHRGMSHAADTRTRAVWHLGGWCLRRGELIAADGRLDEWRLKGCYIDEKTGLVAMTLLDPRQNEFCFADHRLALTFLSEIRERDKSCFETYERAMRRFSRLNTKLSKLSAENVSLQELVDRQREQIESLQCEVRRRSTTPRELPPVSIPDIQ